MKTYTEQTKASRKCELQQLVLESFLEGKGQLRNE
tara:strand:+ start:590 stop:694 length:105 start_codon:yes stop_codon:yes gene_type:complete